VWRRSSLQRSRYPFSWSSRTVAGRLAPHWLPQDDKCYLNGHTRRQKVYAFASKSPPPKTTPALRGMPSLSGVEDASIRRLGGLDVVISRARGHCGLRIDRRQRHRLGGGSRTREMVSLPGGTRGRPLCCKGQKGQAGRTIGAKCPRSGVPLSPLAPIGGISPPQSDGDAVGPEGPVFFVSGHRFSRRFPQRQIMMR